ncbi:MAG: CDP-archaeol synthase [Porphyromonas sp.]|nr:CDP-archaeol synthase [Porphyromonas sp.]
MKRKLMSLIARTITGLVYIAIMLGVIISNSVVAVGMVFALMAGLACYEYQNIVQINRQDFILKILHSVMAALAVYISFAALTAGMTSRQYLVALLPYVAYYLYFTIGELFRRREQPFSEVSHAFFAHIYVAIPLGLLLSMSLGAYQLDSTGVLAKSVIFPRTFWLLPIFVFVWLNDTGAYLVGSLIGRRKLFVRISPKKTVEGAIGGVFFALLGALVFYYFLPELSPWYHWVILAFIVALFATLGDLFESLLKRTYNVKDSGKMLPGHGGILDRIDSILIAALPAYMYVMLAIYL